MKNQSGFRHNTDIGQNFLKDQDVVRWMVRRAALVSGDRVLEIGPGQGVLTRGILTSACQSLDAIELDLRLKPTLETIDDARLTLHWGDALRFDYGRVPPPTHVLANLPYHITTPMIWLLLETFAGHGLRYLLLMTQEEAAQRIVSGGASRLATPLGITIAALGKAAAVRKVPSSAFYPAPHVDSAIIEITLSGEHEELPRDTAWRRLLRSSFAQRRKTLANNWKSAGISPPETARMLAAASLAPSARAEELTIDDWLRLRRELS